MLHATAQLRHPGITAMCGRRVDKQIMAAVRVLAADPANTIVISSGSTAAKLTDAFQDLDVWLAAENGAYVRPPRARWAAFGVEEGAEWLPLYENLNFSWVKSVEQARGCCLA